MHFFNPASNRTTRSVLRLVNERAEPVEVTIDALDAHGEPAETSVHLTVPARNARKLNAQDLESGAPERFAGRLGNGAGKWRLTVRAAAPLKVVSLVFGAERDINNVSR